MVELIDDTQRSGLSDKRLLDDSALTKILVNAVKELKIMNDELLVRLESVEQQNRKLIEQNEVFQNMASTIEQLEAKMLSLLSQQTSIKMESTDN